MPYPPGVGLTHASRFGDDNVVDDDAPAIMEDSPTDGDAPDDPGGDGDLDGAEDDTFGGFDE